MPAMDRNSEGGLDTDDKNSKGKAGQSKSKDVSHVPCKFFKVGSCTAGGSCPFSHNLSEPGAPKETCAWFVKGNCKFGHKCALAHVLPGQSMSMDRKNKKAAQLAANANKEINGVPTPPKPGSQIKKKELGPKGAAGLFTKAGGVPSRAGRPPITMPLKASISAPAPASQLEDTDFASSMDGVQGQNEKPASAIDIQQEADSTTSSSSALPLSSPRRPPPSSPAKDFGPIGSPPRNITGTSPSQRAGMNGTAFLSSSPFRNGGGIAASLGSVAVDMNQNVNISLNDDFDDPAIAGMGRRRKLPVDDNEQEDGEMEDFVPSSLTDLLTPEEMSRRMMSRVNSSQNSVPSAKTIQQAQKNVELGGVPMQGLVGAAGPGGGNGGGHRYSRSVPSQSLLGDLSSIWSTGNGEPGLPASPSRLAGLGNGGTPSSFSSNTFGGRAISGTAPNTATSATFDPLNDDLDSAALAMLSPTNASAAFLPGLHQHYKSKQAQAAGGGGLGRAMRNTSNPLYGTSAASGLATAAPGGAGFRTASSGAGGAASSGLLGGGPNYAISSSVYEPSHLSTNAPRHIPSQINIHHNNGGGMGGMGIGGIDGSTILSPGARALQSHAPGQSLPQGLAAGYSRIHAQPPLNSPSSIGGSFGTSMGVGSVGAAGAGFGTSPSAGSILNGMGGYSGKDWAASPPGPGPEGWNGGAPPGLGAPSNNNHNYSSSGANNNSGALDGMFSKLSYSAAASGAGRTQSHSSGGPPGISRNPSGNSSSSGTRVPSGGMGAGGPLSPLSGPVVTGGDDDIFAWDG